MLNHRTSLLIWVALTLCALIQLVCQSIALAQQTTDSITHNRELLRPIEGWRKNLLMERHVYEIAILEHFAMPGTLDLYNFDVSVLQRENETISITLNGSESIEVLSHGMEINPRSGGQIARWHGELPILNSRRKLRAEMHLVIRAMNRFGELRRPDPNRAITLSEMEKESYVVLEESVQRLDEEIVYGIVDAFIQVPERNVQIRLLQLGEESHSYGTVLVYEIDEDKMVIPGDDSPVNPMPPTADMIRRSKAFKDHEDSVRLRFGLPPKDEY